MIAKLTGKIDSFGADWVIVDVNGVGYLASCSRRTLSVLGGIGSAAGLLIETRMREEMPYLYGFCDATERDWFRLLTTVQGVGAKVALSILSVLTPDKLALALAAQDKAAISLADGVGPKLATRLLSELKDKAGGIGAAFEVSSPVMPNPAGGLTGDAVSALTNLGYGRSEALAVVARLQGEGDSLGDIIRKALKELAA